jgi:hypothetical protein
MHEKSVPLSSEPFSILKIGWKRTRTLLRSGRHSGLADQPDCLAENPCHGGHNDHSTLVVQQIRVCTGFAQQNVDVMARLAHDGRGKQRGERPQRTPIDSGQGAVHISSVSDTVEEC